MREGFGVTTILRYVLETCTDVAGATAVLARVPSHMAYNIVLADRTGAVASVELIPGGGMCQMQGGIATNHQHGLTSASWPAFTRTLERRAHLEMLFARRIAPDALADHFLEPPLFQRDSDRGFGTLFTAEYDPVGASLVLRWPGENWQQELANFTEGNRTVSYALSDEPEIDPELASVLEVLRPYLATGSDAAFDAWLASARDGTPDWRRFGAFFAAPSQDWRTRAWFLS